MSPQPANVFAKERALWPRQLLSVMRLEVRRNLLSSSGVWLCFLAFVPSVIAGLHSTFSIFRSGTCTLERDSLLVAGLFQLFYLRIAYFFGTLGIFVRTFRGEMTDRTLHYYLVAPLRRELLVVGKYLVGSIGSAVILVAGGTTCFLGMYAHHGLGVATDFLGEQGLRQLGAYTTITVLACLGYGAVFLALSLLFKNPVIAAVVYLGWESISGMLPATLQLLSVSFYLKPLFPVPIPVVGISGLFTIVVEPIAPWLAVGGLLLFCGVVVTLAAWRFRRAEVEQ